MKWNLIVYINFRFVSEQMVNILFKINRKILLFIELFLMTLTDRQAFLIKRKKQQQEWTEKKKTINEFTRWMMATSMR